MVDVLDIAPETTQATPQCGAPPPWSSRKRCAQWDTLTDLMRHVSATELIEVLFLPNFLCFHCLMNSRCRQLYHQWPLRTYIDYKAHATLKKLKKKINFDIGQTTYLPLLTFGQPPTYIPRLVNIVWECPALIGIA